MTKSEIISNIAKRAGVTNKVAGGVLDAFIGLINETLKEEGQIRIDRLGTFKVAQRNARTGVNPQTKAKITIPAKKAPTFKPAQALKEMVKDS